MRKARVVVAVLALAGCSAPAVSLPVPDPGRAPVTVAVTTTTEPTFVTAPTVAPTVAPTAEPPAGSTTTSPEPPQAALPVAEIPFALAALRGARGGPFQLWSVQVVPGAIELSVVDPTMGQVGYRWQAGGGLEGPLGATAPSGDLVPFGPEAADAQVAGRAFGFVDTYVQGVGVESVTAVGARGAGVLWIVDAARPDGSPVTAVFDASGNLRALNG